jgi:hypothetical protein
MIKAANLCTAFFPTGTGGSNLQRTIGRKAPLPRALGEPAHDSFHTTWTSLYETAPLRTLLKQYVDFTRRPITFLCSKETGASQPFPLNPTGTLSRRHLAQFVSAIDITK